MHIVSTKVLVVGGGPVGLWSVFMCGMMRLRCCLIESLPVLGGQCQTLYSDKPIYDVPGLPEVLAGDLISRLRQQMDVFDPQIFLNTQAGELERLEDGRWRVRTWQKDQMGPEIHADSIILCCGGGAVESKKPPLPNLERYENKNLWYYVPPGKNFSGQKVLIAGGGDSAVDWAVILGEKKANNHQDAPEAVHVIHRRRSFRAQEYSTFKLEKLIEEGHITLHAPYQLEGISGSPDGKIHEIAIKNFEEEVKIIPADTLLAFFGLKAALGTLEQWGLEINQNRIVTDPLTGTTSLPGIYAAGDIASYPHKLRLIVTGFGEVAQIVHHLKGYLFPDQAFTFQHSTTQGLPKALV